ncbi:hypothetical protein PNA2_1011 [Pyrococcus sp. NA2]|uniref:DUF4350 domain-containing protein n=1 Tax=Pyrococcus sp. (strain NA2) TaxID=342949 RepID=UPI000209A9F2|nr:DUF4350 domain-containing protein [Pyrococcus sp. NA2]AEC51927.1 hypothetical protein PNA2_1011 [Pyrococcus sp. NA2]
MRRATYAIMLIFGLGFLILPISIPVFLSNTEFSILNNKWNGLSSFAKLVYEEKGMVIPITDSLNNFNFRKGTLIIAGPDLGYSSLEVERIKEFLENGGTVIIMDDFGTGNQILEGLNLTLRFSRKVPIDPLYFKDYRLPIIVNIEDPELAKNVKGIILNYPSVITGGEGEVFTSKVTLLDGKFGQYPVLVELNYGKGKLILFSDPSVFTNDMFPLNREFIENFVEKYVKPPVYFDEAHHSNFNPYYVGTIVVRRSLDKEKAFYVVLAVGLIALAVESGLVYSVMSKALELVLKILFKEEKVNLEEIIEKLEREGYDRRILEKIVREVGG